MQDRFVAALKAKSLDAKSDRERACYSAEYGVYLCRTNSLPEAQRISADIRKMYVGKEDPEVYVWLMILESLIYYYSSSSTVKKVNILRAYAIAEAINRTDLQQLSAAWLAHQYFNSGDYIKLAVWLKKSGLNRSHVDSARVRACLTLADALEAVGFSSDATAWYGHARDVAVRIGDRASVMASIENRLAIKLDRLWFQSISHLSSADEVERIELELLGGLQFERFTGTDSLSPVVSVWKSRLAVLRGDYKGALECSLAATGFDASFQNTITATADLDLLWIYFKMGAIEESKKRLLLVANNPAGGLSYDDAAVYWHKMSVLNSEIGCGSMVEYYRGLSEQYRSMHVEEINVLRSTVEPLRSWTGVS